DVLLFLHADSFPPPDALSLLDRAFREEGVAGGAFLPQFLEDRWSLRVITWINRIRCRLTGNAYGDQGMFVHAAVFRRLGGFKGWALMEDLDFSQRLRRAGRRVLVRAPVRTSGRRFSERGILRTCGFCTWMIVRHTLGLDTQRYAERWRGAASQ